MFAMRPSGRAAEREAIEFEPARAYISQLRYDSVAFVSGIHIGTGSSGRSSPGSLSRHRRGAKNRVNEVEARRQIVCISQ